MTTAPSDAADTPSRTSRHSKWIHPSAVKFYDSLEVRNAVRCKSRKGVLNLAIDAAWKRNTEVHRPCLWLEFGVFKGEDITHIAGKLLEKSEANHVTYLGTGDDRYNVPVVHGFDSFEGLPTEWKKGNETMEKGAFDLRGVPPTIKSKNVELHTGWFHDTLPAFLDEINADINPLPEKSSEEAWRDSKDGKVPEKFAGFKGWQKMSKKPTPVIFIHADADLYSSTATFLTTLFIRGVVVKGTIIVFDEYTNYDGWEEGEWLAWKECVEKFGVSFKYLAVHAPKNDRETSNNFKHGYQSVSVKVLNVGSCCRAGSR